MFQKTNGNYILSACNQAEGITERYLNPADINLISGYSIEVFAYGLDSPISMMFSEEGDMLVAESGLTSGRPRVLKLVNGQFEVLAEDFRVPILGINYSADVLYISHRGFITKILRDGTRQNIIMGLPSNGDHFNSGVAISPDNKLYFGQGTATNSGVVGNDNEWVIDFPLVCDYPGDYIMLNGQNFETDNILTEATKREIARTGAFSPYGTANFPYEVKKKYLKASGSILKSNLDGTNLQMIAWGFHNPAFLKFDESGQLFVSNNGYSARGSRPIANAPDDFTIVTSGLWYGWPDFAGGEPVTLPRFRPEGRAQPEFLIKNHPNIPPFSYAIFPTNSNIKGFDYNYNSNFGPYGDVYIAEFGSIEPSIESYTLPFAGTGHRVSKIDMRTRTVSTFAINKSGFPSSISREGGFERPATVSFGPDGAMYILDLGLNLRNDPNTFIPNTGVIWRIIRTS